VDCEEGRSLAAFSIEVCDSSLRWRLALFNGKGGTSSGVAVSLHLAIFDEEAVFAFASHYYF
jgi:hypothetical protein